MHRKPLPSVSSEPLPKSSMSSLPSSSKDITLHAPIWKRPPVWIRKHRSRLCLILTVIVILQLLTLIILIGANLAMINTIKIRNNPHIPNNSISQYLTYLKTHQIPRNQIFTNTTLLQTFLDDTFTRDIQPVPCHSHNDYLRDVPLFDALNAGCNSVEADIWIDPIDNRTLLVGHTANTLHPIQTLKNMYIDPIISILDAMNPNTTGTATNTTPLSGPFTTSPTTTLTLLIDFKLPPTTIWPLLQSHLTPLRDKGYLQHYNETTQTLTSGPVTIVVSGSIHENPSLVQSTLTNPHRDIFLDAPLLEVSWATNGESLYNTSNSYYASTAFNAALNLTHFSPSLLTRPDDPPLTAHQLDMLRDQTKAAQNLGLKVRYWGTPGWPVGTRNAVWTGLVEGVGVDVLNVDDVWAGARWGWGSGECLGGWIGVC